jgi:hypothetical protein
MSPEDISGIMKKVQTKMGGQLPEDYVSKIYKKINKN